MAITPEELNRYATGILLGRFDVASRKLLLRISIGGNYYSVLIKARDFLFLSDDRKDIHRKTRKRMFKHKGSAEEVAMAREVATKLRLMAKLRNTASYQLDVSIDDDDAMDCADKSREALLLIDELIERRDETWLRKMPLVFAKEGDVIRFSLQRPLVDLARFTPRRIAQRPADGTGRPD